MNFEEAMKKLGSIRSNTNTLASEYPHDYNPRYVNEWIDKVQEFICAQQDEIERSLEINDNLRNAYQSFEKHCFENKKTIDTLNKEIERFEHELLKRDRVDGVYHECQEPILHFQFGSFPVTEIRKALESYKRLELYEKVCPKCKGLKYDTVAVAHLKCSHCSGRGAVPRELLPDWFVDRVLKSFRFTLKNNHLVYNNGFGWYKGHDVTVAIITKLPDINMWEIMRSYENG